MFYLTSIYQGTKLFKNSIRYRWLRPGQTTLWEAEQAILAHPDNNDLLYSTVNRGSGNPKRHKTAEEKDFFISNGYPRTAVNPENGHIYLVFADLPSAGSTTDRGDIFAIEGTPNAADDSLTWSTVVQVNNDATETDQWNPDVTVNPSGTKLFVGYYSRQEDPDTNKWIRAYGATFDMIPISAKFEPLFAGTTNSTPVRDTWRYDHVWLQAGVCLDENAKIHTPGIFEECACDGVEGVDGVWVHPGELQNFMGDDYTWVAADDSYFYFAWCDRSDIYGASMIRPDPNIRFAKISQ